MFAIYFSFVLQKHLLVDSSQCYKVYLTPRSQLQSAAVHLHPYQMQGPSCNPRLRLCATAGDQCWRERPGHGSSPPEELDYAMGTHTVNNGLSR